MLLLPFPINSSDHFPHLIRVFKSGVSADLRSATREEDNKHIKQGKERRRRGTRVRDHKKPIAGGKSNQSFLIIEEKQKKYEKLAKCTDPYGLGLSLGTHSVTGTGLFTQCTQSSAIALLQYETAFSRFSTPSSNQ